MAARTLLELNVFRYIVEKEKITSQELANLTKADEILLGIHFNVGNSRDIADILQSVCSVSLPLQDML